MLSKIKTFAILLVVLYMNAGNVRGSTFTVSWYYHGQAIQNNTVLQFNMYDTLNLVCKTVLNYYDEIDAPPGFLRPWFVITKGPSAPSNVETQPDNVEYYTLLVENPGTLIYSDYDGLQTGFENFVVIVGHQTIFTNDYYRYVNVGVLRPEDSGTFHCSATLYVDLVEIDGPALPAADLEYPTSGGLTIMVNTKSDQGGSSRAQSALLTYSAFLLGTSKFLF